MKQLLWFALKTTTWIDTTEKSSNYRISIKKEKTQYSITDNTVLVIGKC